MNFRHIPTGRVVYVSSPAGIAHCKGSPYWTSDLTTPEEES
jgi:hypothetical protein